MRVRLFVCVRACVVQCECLRVCACTFVCVCEPWLCLIQRVCKVETEITCRRVNKINNKAILFV